MNFHYTILDKHLCIPGQTPVPIRDNDYDNLPSMAFGERPVFTLDFPAGTLAEGDELTIAIDLDLYFYDQATGADAPVLTAVRHVVTAGEATANSITETLTTRTAAFRNAVNGHVRPLSPKFGVYLKHTENDIVTYLTLCRTRCTITPVIIDANAVPVELDVSVYYTRDEIDAIVRDMESALQRVWVAEMRAGTAATNAESSAQNASDSATLAESYTHGQTGVRDGENSDNGLFYKTKAEEAATAAGTAKTGAETARDQSATWTKGTDEEVARLGGEHSAKTFASNADQSATAANQAKTDAQTARDQSGYLANGTDEQVAPLGVEHSAKGWADQVSAIRSEILAVVSQHYVGVADNYGLTIDGTVISFTWRDPADNDVVHWKRTRLIYKQGGFPANESDGVVLLDNYVRNAHQITPFVFDMLAVSDYYFALFTESTAGVWNVGDDAPRFTTDVLTWGTIAMMSRAGTLLQYPNMHIGSVVDIQTNSLYPALRWKLAHIDYKGAYERIEDFMLDNNRHHNSIWIPNYLPCLGESQTAVQIQFDAPEKSYAPTWDTVFINGKAYYTVSGETYTQLVAGDDYENGDNIAEWQTTEGQTVYTKNHADRISSGCNSWMMSNIRQGLNGRGSSLWTPQNEYDVQSSHSFYTTGWLAGFSDGYLANVMPVRNKTARNTVSAISGGGGGGYDMTLDKFWLPSMKEVYNTNINNIAEGYQFNYFKDVATTNADRIQVDEGGTARAVWLRSANVSYTRSVFNITTSGSSSNYYASNAYAFLPAQCVA